ncbi:LysR family transcriptional regulator [Rhizobium leguminosarum bv. viciae]|uniref:LysR family transcriptional regulator n=1 Tax=Rhizobium leguminosarum bv. viciae TaxID=387 RepID=A0A8I2H2A0_RHILV|nr:LysR substrate-binding domain-containing protein [Rhizobium leguminosarum]MBY5420043.1 LysR family transcriptional regulator [Rhizobium leguminosarum]MBY5793904.1 LysR family transcriptional regulator [Rhizobium leguminosarum]NKK30019.1 LysR family transcriptional regulator [Rhizobium leguminosarum bv. viciae]NKK40379.1 LysR family transcriptional regulator [Rhizobium leguminosarum bv. viciae]NKK64732.1 LysR family transcriptional regulator [Rhizobium leguminosarum bv. viciae]
MAARVPALSALRAFESAARHLNFGRAGDELFVTHSAISKQVRLLEEDLGVALFERRNRAVFLTDAGRRLLVTMSEVLRQISDCCEEIRVGGSAPLVVSCEPTFTQRWLIPRLPQFNALHPDVEVHVLAAGGPVSFDRSHIDLALRRSDFSWSPELFVETVVEERVGPVCAPRLLASGSNDILSLPRIHSATRRDAWSRYIADNLLADPNPPGNQVFEHFYLSIEAAIAGLGAAIGPEPLVADAVESGQLVAPRGYSGNGYSYILLSRLPFEGDARKRNFLSWLRRQFGP